MTREMFYELYQWARISGETIDVEYKIAGQKMLGFIQNYSDETVCHVYSTNYVFNNSPKIFNEYDIDFTILTMLFAGRYSQESKDILLLRKKRLVNRQGKKE